MNKKIVLILIVIILVTISSFFFIFSNDDNIEINEIESTELFDVDHFLKLQLINHNFKISNPGTIYDRYLIESDYDVYEQNIMLDDPIIKFQFQTKMLN